jgi:ABC-type transport system substrate-binding protein
LGESGLTNFTASSIPRPENRWFGNNRGAWANPDYDRLAESFNSTLDQNERVQQMAQMVKLLSEQLPAISLYYDVGAVPHVAALRGPRPVGPDTSGLIAWNIQDWELR